MNRPIVVHEHTVVAYDQVFELTPLQLITKLQDRELSWDTEPGWVWFRGVRGKLHGTTNGSGVVLSLPTFAFEGDAKLNAHEPCALCGAIGLVELEDLEFFCTVCHALYHYADTISACAHVEDGTVCCSVSPVLTDAMPAFVRVPASKGVFATTGECSICGVTTRIEVH